MVYVGFLFDLSDEIWKMEDMIPTISAGLRTSGDDNFFFWRRNRESWWEATRVIRMVIKLSNICEKFDVFYNTQNTQ